MGKRDDGISEYLNLRYINLRHNTVRHGLLSVKATVVCGVRRFAGVVS